MDIKPQPGTPPSERIITKMAPYKWLLLFCAFQILFWTLGPWVIRSNPMYDTMESFVWGNQWQWGYDKHPPFTAWTTALFGNLYSPSDLPIYLLAQLCVIVTFLAVWRLAKEYLSSSGAVLAVLMLTGVLHYSNRVERMTPDTMQSPIWALLALSFFLAVERQNLRYWLATGILAGIAFLTKYQLIVLVIPLFFALLWSKKRPIIWQSPGPWLAALTGFVITLPHLIWLYNNNFPAFHYVKDHYASGIFVDPKSWEMHILAPLEFSLNALGYILLILFVMWPLFKARKTDHKNILNRKDFKHLYLISLALGPTLLTILVGFFNGEKLIPRWTTPYFAWLPLFILVTLRREISDSLFRRISVRCFILAITLWSLRIGYLYQKPYKSHDYWTASETTPAEASMMKAELLWKMRYEEPLPYLGGSHYHVMAMTFYASGKTIPFSNLNIENSLWMKEDDFRKKGGIIAFEQGDESLNEDAILTRYPTLLSMGTFKFRPRVPDDMKDVTYSTVTYYLLPPAAVEP